MSFRYRNLMLNVGQVQGPQQAQFCGWISCFTFTGCGNSGCGNFPNTCHVITCLGGSVFCGLPSCNFTGPVGCRFTALEADPSGPITLEALKRDLQQAIREIDELQESRGAEGVEEALKEIDAAAAELKELRASVAARRKKKG